MQIETTISVKVTKSDGSVVVMGNTTIKRAGDNPSFERNETAIAVQEAFTEFAPRHNLAGTRAL